MKVKALHFCLHCDRCWQCLKATCYKVETKLRVIPLFSLWMTKLLKDGDGEWPMLQSACLFVPSSSSDQPSSLCFSPLTFHNFLLLKDQAQKREESNGKWAISLFYFIFFLYWKWFCFLVLAFEQKGNNFIPFASFSLWSCRHVLLLYCFVALLCY